LSVLQAALKGRRLCATIVDLLGRTIMVRRPFTLGEDGWPKHEPSFTIKAGTLPLPVPAASAA
jgi:pyruvate kinase